MLLLDNCFLPAQNTFRQNLGELFLVRLFPFHLHLLCVRARCAHHKSTLIKDINLASPLILSPLKPLCFRIG